MKVYIGVSSHECNLRKNDHFSLDGVPFYSTLSQRKNMMRTEFNSSLLMTLPLFSSIYRNKCWDSRNGALTVICLFSRLPYFEKKNRVSLWDHVAVRVCVCVSPPPVVARQRLGKNPLIVARQLLGKNFLPLLGNGYVFYAVRVVSKESRRLVLPRTSCFLFYDAISSKIIYRRMKVW
jgi:hypothetical protein